MRKTKQMSEKLFVFIDLYSINQKHGVPNTVTSILTELIKKRDVNLVTWDNEVNGLRTLNVSENLQLSKRLKLKLKTDTCEIFNQRENVKKNFIVLYPGPIIDAHYGKGAFICMMSDMKRNKATIINLVYDFIPLNLKYFDYQSKQSYLDYLFALTFSDQIITISNYVTNDLFDKTEKIFKDKSINDKIVQAVHLAPIVEDRVLGTEEIVNKDILVFGTIEKRKGQLRTIEGFKRIVKNNPELRNWTLKIIGNVDPKIAELFHKSIVNQENIHFMGPLKNDALAKEIRKCSFTVFASEEEGFGLPIIESFYFGKPCISANFGAMSEINKLDELKVNVKKVKKLQEKINLLMENNAELEKQTILVSKISVSNWVNVASQILKIIEETDFKHNEAQNCGCLVENKVIKKKLGFKKQPDLTILISTFNRKNVLEKNIGNLLRLKKYFNFRIFVLDNASSDGTKELLQNTRDIEYHINPVNLGMVGNLKKASNFVNSDFVWVIGDDDFITFDGIEKVCSEIYKNPYTCSIMINFEVFYKNADEQWNNFDPILESRTLMSKDFQTLRIPILEASMKHDNLFTAIYQFIWRQDVFRSAFSFNHLGNEFNDGQSAAPSASYFLNNSSQALVKWIGTPGVIANGSNSWSSQRGRWHSLIIHEYLEKLLNNGAPIEQLQKWSGIHLNLLFDYYQGTGNKSKLSKDEYEMFITRLRRFQIINEKVEKSLQQILLK